MDERTARRDGGFSLIEMLISIVVSGIIAGVLGTAVNVIMRNDGPTQERFNSANDSLSITNAFPADVAATPPAGREVGDLPSGCPGPGADAGTNLLRLTWTEAAGGPTTTYRVSYRLDSPARQLVRVSCSGPDGVLTGGTIRPLGTLVADATLEYSSLDAEDITLVLTMATTPPSTARIRGVRMNPAASLPPPPVVSSRSAIRLQTTTEALQYSSLATVITFDTVVLNAGTTFLSSVGIADPVADPGSVACAASTLAPGDTTACTFTHTVDQADLDAGSVTSATSATGTPPSGGPVSNVAGTVTVPGVQAPQIAVTKTTTSTGYKVAGDVVAYEVTGRNTGNVTLSSLAVTDPKADGAIGCSPTTLAPGATATCTYQYTVQSSDLVIGGSVATAATATATSPAGIGTSATSNTVVVPFQASPGISATKATSRTQFGLLDEVIDYTITVTNTGNVGLSGVAVNDPKAIVTSCTATSLAPATSLTCSASHVVTADDITAGAVVNQATASGQPASGGPAVTATTNEVSVPYSNGPSMTVTKAHDPPPSSYRGVGERLTYTLTVRNSGPIELQDVAVTDPMNDGSPSVCTFATLAVGTSRTCSASHTVTAVELGASITNTARATATSANGDVTVDSNTVTVNFLPAPALAVEMTSSPVGTFATLGAAIDYTMTVTNTGNVALSSVGVTGQTLAGVGAATCAASTLAVGASTTCASSYTTTTDDASGWVSNAATVAGTYASSEVSATSASVTVNSAVPCSVAGVTSDVASVGRKNNGRLLAPVVVAVTTTGVCSGLRIQYYPSTSRPGVVDAMARSGATWTYTIPDNGSKASTWVPGPARVDVLPATGSTPLNDTAYQPFTVA